MALGMPPLLPPTPAEASSSGSQTRQPRVSKTSFKQAFYPLPPHHLQPTVLNLVPSPSDPAQHPATCTVNLKSVWQCRHMMGMRGGQPVQLSEWWADFDERVMRPVFSKPDSGTWGDGE